MTGKEAVPVLKSIPEIKAGDLIFNQMHEEVHVEYVNLDQGFCVHVGSTDNFRTWPPLSPPDKIGRDACYYQVTYFEELEPTQRFYGGRAVWWGKKCSDYNPEPI